jgi:hydroxymethylglutaryl-CoA reductase
MAKLESPQQIVIALDNHKAELIGFGNEACRSMVERGGGIEDIRFRILSTNSISIDIFVNVCDSMGANLVNTVSEQVA